MAKDFPPRSHSSSWSARKAKKERDERLAKAGHEIPDHAGLDPDVREAHLAKLKELGLKESLTARDVGTRLNAKHAQPLKYRKFKNLNEGTLAFHEKKAKHYFDKANEAGGNGHYSREEKHWKKHEFHKTEADKLRKESK
jgi:hypothetical protein